MLDDLRPKPEYLEALRESVLEVWRERERHLEEIKPILQQKLATLEEQKVLFPEDLVYDGEAFQTPVTCLFFRDLERSGREVEDLVARTGFALVWEGVKGTESRVQAGNNGGRLEGQPGWWDDW